MSDHYRSRRNVKSEYEEKPDTLVQSVLNHCKDVSPNSLTAIEVGPGAGEILRAFTRKGVQTFAIELSAEMIVLSREIAPSTTYFHANVLDFDWQLSQVDIVYAGALIHLFTKVDAKKVLTKFHEWLTQDGILFINTTIADISGEGFSSKKDSDIEVLRYRKKWREEELISFVEASGFEIKEKLFTSEIDRDKKWIGLICKK